MLLAVSCDLPAGRKVCGFFRHAAKLDCSRCCTTNNSDFNKKKWKMRENKKHKADVNSLGKSKNIVWIVLRLLFFLLSQACVTVERYGS